MGVRRSVLVAALAVLQLTLSLSVLECHAGEPYLKRFAGVYRLLAEHWKYQSGIGSSSIDVPSANVYRWIDPEFQQIYNQAKSKAYALEDVIVAVVDTGIIAERDDQLLNYDGRIIAGRDITTLFPQDNDSVPITVDDVEGLPDTALLPSTLNGHGTRVASQAAFGTPRIKLIDVAIKTSAGEFAQTGVTPHIATGIEWAISRGASIVTASILLEWDHPDLIRVVTSHPDVLFLGSGDNTPKNWDLLQQGDKNETFLERALPIYRSGNFMLVGGCTQSAQPHHKRGFGRQLVDIAAPSDWLPTYIPHTMNIVINKVGAGLDVTTVNEDDGISFGIPMVANVVAKMSLICSRLRGSPDRVAHLIRRSGLPFQEKILPPGCDSIADLNWASFTFGTGVMNPSAAYQQALVYCVQHLQEENDPLEEGEKVKVIDPMERGGSFYNKIGFVALSDERVQRPEYYNVVFEQDPSSTHGGFEFLSRIFHRIQLARV